MYLRRWLRPGMGIKRWLLVVFVGELGLALAGALALRQVYRDVEVSGVPQAILYVATLQFLPYVARGVILAGLGAGLFAWGSLRVVRAIMAPFRSTDGDQPLVERNGAMSVRMTRSEPMEQPAADSPTRSAADRVRQELERDHVEDDLGPPGLDVAVAWRRTSAPARARPSSPDEDDEQPALDADARASASGAGSSR